MRFFGRLTQVVVAPLLPAVGVAAGVAVATSASAGVAPAVVRLAEKTPRAACTHDSHSEVSVEETVTR